METVTIQCGACGQVIAVSKEHLGQQVQCPLCAAVIEAPPPEPVTVPILPPGANDEDSIFAPPEEEEDIFGQRNERPLVQMPSETALSRKKEDEERTEALPGPAKGPFGLGPPSGTQQGDSAAPLTDAATQAELASFGVRRPSGRSSLGAILMIFLIPYSVVATSAVVYLLYERSQRAGLDLLPDPDREDGAPRRVKHDLALPDKLRTRLGSPIALGDVVVTPLKIERTRDNDLVLHLKIDNNAADTQFNPFPDSYHRYMTRQSTPVPPYTFLSASGKNGSEWRLYGGYTARFRQPPDQRSTRDNGTFSGIIGPQETVYAELTTNDKDRYLVPRILAGEYELLWRVHLRRGFITVGGRDVSASGVIGVAFPPDAVMRQRS